MDDMMLWYYIDDMDDMMLWYIDDTMLYEPPQKKRTAILNMYSRDIGLCKVMEIVQITR